MNEFDRFMQHVMKLDSGCWMWMRAQHPETGHGKYYWAKNKRIEPASRACYRLFISAYIPDGHVVMHRCDNGWCVNPEHLEAGTQSKNIQDMYDRGRGWYQKRAAS